MGRLALSGKSSFGCPDGQRRKFYKFARDNFGLSRSSGQVLLQEALAEALKILFLKFDCSDSGVR